MSRRKNRHYKYYYDDIIYTNKRNYDFKDEQEYFDYMNDIISGRDGSVKNVVFDDNGFNIKFNKRSKKDEYFSYMKTDVCLCFYCNKRYAIEAIEVCSICEDASDYIYAMTRETHIVSDLIEDLREYARNVNASHYRSA